MSLILVTVDCLRADHVGWMGYAVPTTPFLDALSGESTVFSNAIAAGSPTYYAFPAIMASRPPLGLGRDVIGISRDEITLASSLQAAGYRTAAFVAGNPYLTAAFGYDAGFDEFENHLSAPPSVQDWSSPDVGRNRLRTRANAAVAQISHKLGPLGALYDEVYFRYGQRIADTREKSWNELRCFPAADIIVDQACDWIARQGSSPFFVWLHLMDPHAPYYPSESAMASLGSACSASDARYLNSYWARTDLDEARLRAHRERVVALYDAGIRHADQQISKLVLYLRRLGLWQDCIFTVTADHGEEFLDRGGRFHAPLKLTEELIRVPLLLRVPAEKEERRVNAPFSLINLAPTLLDVLDIPISPGFYGRSYWPKIHKNQSWADAAITECIHGCNNPFQKDSRMGQRILSVREERYKLVVNFETGCDQMFDVLEDSDEQNPLPRESLKAIRARLLQCANRHLERNSGGQNPDSRLEVQLRELRGETTTNREPTCA